MKFICKALSGSKAYGLDTPQSDTDVRGVYCFEDFGNVAGLEVHEGQYQSNSCKGGIDEVYHEVRRFLHMLRRSSIGQVELLHTNHFISTSPYWELIQRERSNLVDSSLFYSSAIGYARGEYHRAFNKPVDGKEQPRSVRIAKYGFDPKPAVNLIRLVYCARIYVTESFFPVNIMAFNKIFGERLMAIKTSPESFSKEEVLELAVNHIEWLKEHEGKLEPVSVFNKDVANGILKEIYSNII